MIYFQLCNHETNLTVLSLIVISCGYTQNKYEVKKCPQWGFVLQTLRHSYPGGRFKRGARHSFTMKPHSFTKGKHTWAALNCFYRTLPVFMWERSDDGIPLMDQRLATAGQRGSLWSLSLSPLFPLLFNLPPTVHLLCSPPPPHLSHSCNPSYPPRAPLFLPISVFLRPSFTTCQGS